MEKVEYFEIVRVVAKHYCNGSDGSFYVYRCKNGDKKFLVCWGTRKKDIPAIGQIAVRMPASMRRNWLARVNPES